MIVFRACFLGILAFLSFLESFLGAPQLVAKPFNWEVDQVMRVVTPDGKKNDFDVKWLVTKQKLWRSIKPKGAKDDSETQYSIFDSVRFYDCKKTAKKGTCNVLTLNAFDPVFMWASAYQMDLTIKKISLKDTGTPRKIADQDTSCYKELMVGVVGDKSTNNYRVVRSGRSCYAEEIDVSTLARRMVKKMKTIKSFMSDAVLEQYEGVVKMGVPLKQVATIKSSGVGPYGVGKTKIIIETRTVSSDKLDMARLKLPKGFTEVDMSNQLRDVSFTPGKN